MRRAVPAQPGRRLPRHGRLLVRHRGARPLRGEGARAGVPLPSPRRPAASATVVKRQGRLDQASGIHPVEERELRALRRRRDRARAGLLLRLRDRPDQRTSAPSSTARSTPTSSPSSFTSSAGGSTRPGSRPRWAAATASRRPLAAGRQAGAPALPEALPAPVRGPARLQAAHHLRLPDHDQDPAADHQPGGAVDPRAGAAAHADGGDPGVQDLRPPATRSPRRGPPTEPTTTA